MSHSSDRRSPLDDFVRVAARDLLGPHVGPFKDLWVTGKLAIGPPAIAVVGARAYTEQARGFAIECATALANAGAVVVSGGAEGIDRIAHVAAMDAGGTTWLVSPAGAGRVYPPRHVDLFERVIASGGAIVTASSPELENPRGMFHRRNRLLVALSKAVVVIQAGKDSGTLDTAQQTRGANKGLFVAGVAPWAQKEFEGSAKMLDEGVEAVVNVPELLKRVGIQESGQLVLGSLDSASSSASSALENVRARLSAHEMTVAEVLSQTPAHLDEVASKSHLAIPVVVTALLTLALENVVVEGPSGFFRRANPR